MFSFFLPISLPTKDIERKKSCVSGAVGTIILYGVFVFTWLLSSTIRKNHALFNRMTGKFPLQKTWNKSSCIWPPFIAYVWTTRDNLWSWWICLASSSRRTRFSLFRDWDSSSAEFLRKTMTYFLSMAYFVARAIAVAINSKRLFTGISRNMNAALQAEVQTAQKRYKRTLVDFAMAHCDRVRITKKSKFNRKEKWKRILWRDWWLEWLKNYVAQSCKQNETQRDGNSCSSV